MQDYEDWQSPHKALDLLKAICVLEAYPIFEHMIPELKKELKSRFDNIPINKRGNKVIGFRGVRYCPNGIVNFTSVYTTLTSTLEPYEYCPPSKKKKKEVSNTTKVLKERFQYLCAFYKYLAYQQVGIKYTATGNRFKEKYILKCREMFNRVYAEKMPDSAKLALQKDIYGKMFGGATWRYPSFSEILNPPQIDAYLIESFIERVFGSAHNHRGSITSFIVKENPHNNWREDDEKKFVEMMPKKYFFKMVIPDAKTTAEITSGDFYAARDGTRYQYLSIHFDTLDELLSTIKSNMTALGNKTVLTTFKRLGLDIEVPKDEKVQQAVPSV